MFRHARGLGKQLYHRLKKSSMRQDASPQVRPYLEELEPREVPSASPTNVAAPDGLAAQPNLSATPMLGSGSNIYYTPQEIRQAYAINQAVLPNGQPATGAGQTIAIVDAYHDPNIANDLAVFDAQFGLAAPPSFKVVQMNGATQTNANWAGETALDVEWAHAVAPQANILLVEAASNNYSDLLAAVQYAASQPGVVTVSMSWGGPEFFTETSYDAAFATPKGHIGGSGLPGGITFVASSGDSGAWVGAQWPASSPQVLAVGGTSLYTSGGSYSSESAWRYGGGGYSYYEHEPTWQQSVQKSGWRTSPDVSYDANPNTGMLVYNSFALPSGYNGWWIDGGTSAGAPQWAGILALADQARAANGLGSLGNAQSLIYGLSVSDFHDVTSGSNGYSGAVGYDMATGRGSPIVNRIVADLAGVRQAAGSFSVTSPTSQPGGGTVNQHAEGIALGGANSITVSAAGTSGPWAPAQRDVASPASFTAFAAGDLAFLLPPSPLLQPGQSGQSPDGQPGKRPTSDAPVIAFNAIAVTHRDASDNDSAPAQPRLSSEPVRSDDGGASAETESAPGEADMA